MIEKKVYVENNRVVVEVDGARVRHSLPTIQKCIKKLSDDLEMWRNYERLLTKRAADGDNMCRAENVSKHNPNAWQDGIDAWQNGYDDAMYDGIDTSSEMPCKCNDCLSAYDKGQQEAIKEIFGRGQSAQQTLALDASPQAVVKVKPLEGGKVLEND